MDAGMGDAGGERRDGMRDEKSRMREREREKREVREREEEKKKSSSSHHSPSSGAIKLVSEVSLVSLSSEEVAFD